MRKIATVAVIGLVVLSGLVRADGGVSIKATPQNVVAVGGVAYVRVIIRIDRHSDNKKLIFWWESPDGDCGRKDQQINGEDSPTLFDTGNQEYFGKQGLQLPPGHYTFHVTVERAAGTDPSDQTKVTVLGGGDLDNNDR